MFLSEAKEGTTTKPGLFTNAEFPFEDARLRFRSPGQADTVYASRISRGRKDGKRGARSRFRGDPVNHSALTVFQTAKLV